MITIAKRITDEERIARYKSLNLTPEEEKELLEYDKAVERDEETEYDLSPEQEKIARKFAHTGTRKTTPKKPTAYKFSQKNRKPNATKGGIISELADFLEKNSQFSIENLQIANKERQITFTIGDNAFDLTLIQHRKPKS